MPLPTTECDVLVVGSGNAGFSAALSAAETKLPSGQKPTVLLIDKCPEEWVGGNSYFTAGAYRTVHDGLDDVLPLVNNVGSEKATKIDLAPYTVENFAKDMENVCAGRSDKELSRMLITDSRSTVKWLADHGIRFQLSFNRQAYEVDGRFKFWGGLCLKTEDGGKGLIADHLAAAKHSGVLLSWGTGLKGVRRQTEHGKHRYLATVLHEGVEQGISTNAIVFAAGGFESNPRMRSQYLGPGWDMAMVRGTPYNMGDCIELAIRDLDALPVGNWSGCHATCWDANADPSVGDREASNEYTKSGYPLGLMINVEGNRFVDEGVAMRNYTYAKFGRAILQQPDHVAFQIWDARTTPWLRSEEYRPERLKENRFEADTIEELADVLSSNGLKDREKFLSTCHEYNSAVYAFQQENPSAKWDPSVLDGVSTQSSKKQLPLAKSNWALPLDKGPFLAVKVTCGVTFTFGGLKVDAENAQLISATTRKPIPGLFCVVHPIQDRGIFDKAKGEERRLTDVSISWTDASGERLRLGPSKDIKTTLLLREDPKTWGWIQVTFPSTDIAHAKRKSKGAKPRLLPTPDRNTFIDLLPPNLDVFASTFQPHDEPDSVLVVDVTLEDPDVVWIRARDAGSVALNDAQMEAVHLLKSFSETSRFRISVPSDKKVKKHSWEWDKLFADDTARTAFNYGFVVDKRRRAGLRKPRREADWRNYHIRGKSPRQPVQARLPFSVNKNGKEVGMTGFSGGLAVPEKILEDKALYSGVSDVKKTEGEDGINNEEDDI